MKKFIFIFILFSIFISYSQQTKNVDNNEILLNKRLTIKIICLMILKPKLF